MNTSNSSSRWSRRKPLWVVAQQEEAASNSSHSMQRHLSLWDLVMVGVGGTIGSGVFVLAGYIAHHYAGPATVLSFAISGLAAACSGLAYAELAGRLPAAGSTYVYCYVAIGELAAVWAAACLTLEYAVSGAAVARSWGEKVVLWFRDELHWGQVASWLDPGYGLNPMAFFISALTVALLWNGVQESKSVSNFFTLLKVGLVLFMIFGGFYFFDATDNFHPFLPLGFTGVVRGATSSFFGYLGFDEVCCIAGEALHPHRDLPRAVLLTLAIVTVLYMLAALALTGMQHYTNIDDTSGFPAAFASNGAVWAQQLTAAGEVISLPVVVLISLMAQPRLQYALVQDGLLPNILGRVDGATGNLKSGTLLAGTAMTIIAGCVPFNYLDDLISAGILVAFCMTNSCLVVMRCENRGSLLSRGLVLYNGLAFATSLCFSHSSVPVAVAVFMGCITFLTACMLSVMCPRTKQFGGSLVVAVGQHDDSHDHESYFESPCVPWIPFLGMFCNWYLIAQLEWTGLALLLLYLGMTTVLYLSCRGPGETWDNGGQQYQGVHQQDDDDEAAGIMLVPSSRRHDETD